jgi:hypothetical protein
MRPKALSEKLICRVPRQCLLVHILFFQSVQSFIVKPQEGDKLFQPRNFKQNYFMRLFLDLTRAVLAAL